MSTIIPSDRPHRAFAFALALASASASTLALAPASAFAQSPSPAPLDALRERFRDGMDKYRAGAYADAIVIWESIYRELGAEKGYRVAFDLGRAYDELGELIKAAEHYETYLERVAARRRDGESLEPNVEKQEADARVRLEKIAAVKGRIRVRATTRPVVVHVDNAPPRVAGFVVYVEPGAHSVTFGAGATTDVRDVTVQRGELLDVEVREEAPPPPPPPLVVEPRFETRVEHPFSSTVVWVGAAVAVVSFVVPAISYASALSIKSDYDSTSTRPQERQRLAADYDSARSNAYASIAVPALFTATASGLALWYVLGRKETRVPIAPQATITPEGAVLGMSARF